MADTTQDGFLDIADTKAAVVVSTGRKPFSLKSLNLAKKCPFVVVEETGVKISSYPFEKIKFQENQRSRLSIISDEVIGAKLHYDDDIKSFFCTGGACCEFSSKPPTVRYIYPVVQYTDVDGKGRILSPAVEIKLLVLGYTAYESILSIKDNKGDLSQYDMVISCTDASYQKIDITEAGPATWVKSAAITDYVMDYMEKYGDKLLMGLGKVYTDAQLRELFGATSTGAKGITEESLDDILKV